MRRKAGIIWNRIFFILFCVLTILCFCPIGYGSYGTVDRIVGIPNWAFYAFIIGIIFFILQWIYLFLSGLATSDEDLPRIFSELRQPAQGASNQEKGGE